MTLPNERMRSIAYTRQLLRDLLDPRKTPRIPKSVRNQAASCLRHFPWHSHMEEVATDMPDIFELEDIDYE